MSENWEALFKLKQDDWIEVCGEVDSLRKELAESREESKRNLIDETNNTVLFKNLFLASREEVRGLAAVMEKKDEALRALKLRIHFIGMPQEGDPRDWKREIELLESALTPTNAKEALEEVRRSVWRKAKNQFLAEANLMLYGGPLGEKCVARIAENFEAEAAGKKDGKEV